MVGEITLLHVILIILGCVFSALTTMVLIYLKDLKTTVNEDLKKQDKKVKEVDDRLNALPEKYVFRDDFIRWSISIDKKIENVAKDVKELVKREG